ncbi:MAG: hypothetical protein K2L45_02225 [Muribaculaceae bacterium]|nr:hypothetical protein [Muribaculaceae bacterium]
MKKTYKKTSLGEKDWLQEGHKMKKKNFFEKSGGKIWSVQNKVVILHSQSGNKPDAQQNKLTPWLSW